MKKFLLILAAVIMVAACGKKEEAGYKVTVKFEGDVPDLKTDARIIMTNMDTSEYAINDTATVVNGQAMFTGSVKSPDLVVIRFLGVDQSGSSRNICTLFLENDTYTISVPADTNEEPVITGGRTQHVVDSLNTVAKSIIKAAKLDTLQSMFETATDVMKDSITTVRKKVYEDINNVFTNYINKHPHSMFALYQDAMQIEYMPADSAMKLEKEFASIPEYANNKYFKKIQKYVSGESNFAVGKQAPDFTENDPAGNPIKFSDIYKQNKITMVDFWASWCSPCRQFNPILRRLYYKYKNKGFGILGVSLDKEQDAWLDAIAKDRLSWPQVSDLKGWDNAVSKAYLVTSIPQNIFVDSTGRIVLSRAEEDEIDSFLNDNLNQQ
ncbi:MAG: AhpC/TSA family protein [Bacteroidales bacterium]|jgi:thiol-disulfide isomerase/thioredoxin|nr:AhpC/TSA family protein [Bacteroidales bacterium]